jgi:FAD-linked oxidoreductase
MTLFSRRNLLMAGAAGAVGAPILRHGIWNAQDFDREGFGAAAPQSPDGARTWTNWSGIHRSTPETIAVPSSEDELASFITQSGGRVRPVGSGHSFTGLVPSDGAIVDVSRLSGLMDYDVDRQTVTLGAGTRIRHAARLMDDVGLAFPNQPDIDVQTLAGAFATATHGTGRTLTALHDYCVGFRLATASGELVDVTENSIPDLFAAGKVSLGSLGVIVQYTLQVTKSHKLHRRLWLEDINTLLERAEELASAHRSFEFYYLPHTGLAAGITHDLAEDGATSAFVADEEDSFVADLKNLRDSLGWWPWLRRRLIRSAAPMGPVEDRIDASWKLLSTVRNDRFNESEYHIPRENGLDAFRSVMAKLEQRKEVYFPVEVRFTAADGAWLSPFNGGERISIAVHAPYNERYDYLNGDFEPIFRAHGGRPHWGKLHTLAASDLAELYPRFGDFQEVRNGLDPEGKFLNDHIARIFGVTGYA